MRAYVVFLSMLISVVVGGEIYLADDASEAEKFAARDFRTYYQRVTGNSIDQKDNPLTVYLGQAAKQASWFKPQQTQFEEGIITSNGNELVISGDTRGTVWGVYYFLENYLGCAFLAPDTELVPSFPDWKLPQINERIRPAFMRRALDGAPRCYPKSYRMRRRESILTFPEIWMHHGSPHGSHTHAAYVKDWPEGAPFARTSRGSIWKSTLCLSSPEAVRLVAEKMCDYIKKDREGVPPAHWRVIYDFSANDGANTLCQCQECARRAEEDGGYSDLNTEFVNRVAEIVGQKYPDVLVQTFAYSDTLNPPKKVKARENVVIRFCRGGLMNPLLPESESAKLFSGWQEKAEKLAIWAYWKTYTGAIEPPYIIPRQQMQTEMQFCRDNKVIFYYGENEAAYHRSFYDFQHYLGTVLMFNPDADVRKHSDIFFAGYYGKAAPEMKKYLEYLEKRMAETSPGKSTVFLDSDFFSTANDLLDKAENLSKDDPLSLLHVRRERIPIDQTQLLNQLKFPPTDKAKALQRYKGTLAELYSHIARLGWKKERYESFLIDLENECNMYELMPFPIPEQFQKQSLIDLHWPDFHLWGGAARCKVADPEAASGAAYEPRRDREHKHGLPFAALLYHAYNRADFDDVSFQLKTAPPDEKYHWYKIGETSIERDVRISCGPRGLISAIDIHLYRAVSGIVRTNKEVWVSLKLTGPAYVEGSNKPNGIFIERVIVAEPEKVEK